MKSSVTIFLFALFCASMLKAQNSAVRFDFCGQELQFSYEGKLPATSISTLSTESIISYYNNILEYGYEPAVTALKNYIARNSPDDWLLYQLIRRTAQNISPKEKNYYQYTLHKWFFLTRTGYDAMLAISNDKILFYVQCDENIYNIPYRTKNGKQYVCLNYHDYGTIDFLKERFTEVVLPAPPPVKTFSYKVSRIPDFQATEYLEKDLHFTYNQNDYHFKIKVTPQIQKLFTNYPVVDYDAYMNIPLSRETYNSLIPQLKKSVKKLNVKSGVDFLMRFTRYAFLFEPDSKYFGSEKRLSPEQTLFYNQSDCEDRVALFFCLIKEIYNLPMIVLCYPDHVTIAVQFDKPAGETIDYKGLKYSICEPTPQHTDLPVGRSLAKLRGVPYEVVYQYSPR